MKPYTIELQDHKRPKRYMLLNPFGEVIAAGMSWRVARRIADLLNADRGQ